MNKKKNHISLKFQAILILTIITTLISTVSCSGGNWKYVCDTPFLHEAEGVLFENNKGLFYGHYISNDDYYAENGPSMWELYEAVILKIDIAKSRNWKKVFSGRGEIIEVKKIGGKGLFLALGREFLEAGKERAYFLVSNDFGDSWAELSRSFPLFIGFDLDSDLNGYAWSENKIYRTIDGAKNWVVIRDSITLQRGWAQPQVDNDGMLWFYSITEGLVGQITPSNDEKTERPAENFRVDDLFIAHDNAVWFVGRAGKDWEENVLLLKKGNDRMEGFSVVADLPYFLPDSFYVGPNVINIFGSDMSVRPPKRMLMKSVDQGKTWKREAPKDAYANGPVYFENENIIWNVATKDRIQRRHK